MMMGFQEKQSKLHWLEIIPVCYSLALPSHPRGCNELQGTFKAKHQVPCSEQGSNWIARLLPSFQEAGGTSNGVPMLLPQNSESGTGKEPPMCAPQIVSIL